MMKFEGQFKIPLAPEMLCSYVWLLLSSGAKTEFLAIRSKYSVCMLYL